MQSAFSTKDIEADGSASSARARNWYYGSHIGVGERFALAPQWGMDVGGRLLWTHQQGVTLHVREDSLRQDPIDSVRSRVGARVTYAANDLLSWRAGVGSEYEFSAKATSSYMGSPIHAPRLKGHSAFAEIGATLTLLQGATLDFGVEGSLGRYQGIGGALQARIPF